MGICQHGNIHDQTSGTTEENNLETNIVTVLEIYYTVNLLPRVWFIPFLNHSYYLKLSSVALASIVCFH